MLVWFKLFKFLIKLLFYFFLRSIFGLLVYQSKIGTTLLGFVSFTVYHSNKAILCITENYQFAVHLSNLILWTTTKKSLTILRQLRSLKFKLQVYFFMFYLLVYICLLLQKTVLTTFKSRESPAHHSFQIIFFHGD